MTLRPFESGRLVQPLVVVVAAAFTAALVVLGGGGPAGQTLSNVGLCVAALLAGLASVRRSSACPAAVRRFWLRLGLALLSWSAGQAVWTWYESVLHREVPFPSLADVGYLGLPPLAAAALLSLPLAAPTMAGRVRTLLDGLMVAASLLLCSWVLVLGPVFRAGADGALSEAISLAYPIGDVVVITIVVYTGLRSRHVRLRLPVSLPVSLPLVGAGLLAFSVADSGFVYQTTTNLYSSGSTIDIGWFLGFVLMLLAALRARTPVRPAEPGEQQVAASAVAGTRSFGNLLPYAAVSAALLTSALEVLRTGHTDVVVSWIRTMIMVLLVLRQILTLRENQWLTRDLERRVARRTAELAASRERFVALVQHSSDIVTVVDRAGTVQYQSGSILRILGHRPEAVEQRPVFELMSEEAAASLRAALEHAAAVPMRIHTVGSTWRHADGHLCRVEVTVTNLLDNADVGGLVLNSRDVTDRVELEAQLTGMAFTDSLTGLPNRALFKDRLQHALSRRDHEDETVAVLFLDLDGFKSVNDTLGHSAGDELLVQVAERLRTVVRPGDTVARFGGDEFAVLLEDFPRGPYRTDLAERINAAIRQPFDLQDERVHVAASVGIARFDENALTAEQVLRNADLAMYQAKSQGVGGHAAFQAEMHAGLVERVRLEADLRRAVEESQFVLHYQPMVSMRSGQITGVEALVRWQHPERGLLAPRDFVPAAEATGLIRAIGLVVLREACRQVVCWQSESADSALRMSVNVSPRQLHDPEFPHHVRRALDDAGLPAELLTLEMTESVLIDHRDETLATLTTLHDMGVRLAIDDFGTGYSSLSYLHRFPVDVLKIDRSFVERLASGGDGSLVSTILRLGQSLQLETVAEGIERPQEMLMLRRQGCTTGQGFHFSPPVTAADLAGMLLEQHSGALDAERRTPA